MPKQKHWDAVGTLSVLGVDDDAVNLMVVEQLLAPEGWKITSAGDGDEALQALEQDSTWPDVIFLDYYLRNGETGEEVCRRMRELFGAVEVPIILCTALTDGATAIQNALQAGATDYLLKPYERSKMIDKIRKHVGHKLAPNPSPTLRAAPAPQPAPAVAAPTPQQKQVNQLLEMCRKIDLEFVGMKLTEAGVTLADVRGMDDYALRKAGVVVKSQREKIFEAVRAT